MYSNPIFAQATVSLTVTDGVATTTCNDALGAPDPKWAVDVQFEGWKHYLGNPFCFNQLPTIQFSQQITCLPDLPIVNVCFKAYENDGLLCNTNEQCRTEICERFVVPYAGAIDYTLSLPEGQPSGGFVKFTIQTDGTLTDQGNNNICGAIDLGELNSGQQLGDATQDIYNNYCSNGQGEPNTIADGAGWQNNFSVWFTFTTSNDPGSIASILGLSDPQNTGEFLNLQLALYQSSTTDCRGDFELVTSSWNNTDEDELMVANCLEPNRTYYILVDGLIPPPTTRFYGLFGLQVKDEGIAEAPDQICEATALGIVPMGGQLTTGMTVSNLCATGTTTDPPNSIFSADNSVWFTFQAPDSRHVLISATSDEERENGGLGAVDIQLAVFSSDNETCNGNFTEINVGYDPAGLNENLELSCLTPGETYYLLLNGGPVDRGGVFSVTVADAGYDPIVETINPILCFGDTLVVGSDILTVSGPIFIPLLTEAGCDSLVEGVLTILPQNLLVIDSSVCAGTGIEIAGNLYNTTGAYTDVLTAFDGCDSTIITNLEVAPLLNLAVTQTVEATGYQTSDGVAIATVSGGIGPYTYQWENNEPNPIAMNLLGGSNYCITVTDAIGCTAENCVLILFPSNIIVSIEDDLLNCSGDTDGTLSFQISNGAIPYSYSWENSVNGLNGTGTITVEGGNAIINNLPPGTYDFSITDAFGSTTASATIIEPQPIITNLNETICFGDSILVGNIFYKNSGPILEVLTDQFGCDSVVTGTLTVLPELLVINEVNNVAASCFGSCDGILEIQITGGAAPYNINWSDGQHTSEVMGLCAGSFQVTVTDANNCIATRNLNISEPIEFVSQVASSQSIMCFGEEDGQAIVTTNGTPVSFLWDNGETTEEALNLTAGLHEVTVTNFDGCTTVAAVFIDAPAAPMTVEIITMRPISCSGASDGIIAAQVSSATDNLTYEWSTGSIDSSLENIISGLYEITVSDGNGCTAMAAVELATSDPVIPQFTVEDITCLSGDNSGAILIDTVVGGTPPFLFSLNPEQGFTTMQSFGFLAEGSYELYIEEINGCQTVFPFVVSAPEELIVTLGVDETIKLGEEINIEAISNSNQVIFEWQLLDSALCTVCSEFIDTPVFTQLYQVQVTDTLTNCQAFAEKLVTVEKHRSVYIPNTFSPNGDGINDMFNVAIGEDVAVILSLTIFNRWGAPVYEQENIGINELTGWEGKKGSRNAEPGVYIFVAEVLFKDGFKQQYRGDLTLIR